MSIDRTGNYVKQRRLQPGRMWLVTLLAAAGFLTGAFCVAQEIAVATGDGFARSNAVQTSAFPTITAATAIVINRDTGAVIGSKDPDTLRPNPSTTKLMTALIAIERNAANLDAIVGPISSKSADTPGSTMNLNAGDSLSLRDLLYGLMLPSGNDAGVAIAEWVGGSEEAFVALMNQKAKALGLSHTSYRGPSGYDALEQPAQCVPPYSAMFNCGHYSTARDLATLAQAAMKEQPIFARIVQTATWTPTSWLTAARTPRTVQLNNDNLLLSSLAYPGANGVKTGMSTSAGFCMVASATQSGHSVLTVVMGCASDAIRHAESKQLLDWGFAQLGSSPTVVTIPRISVSASPSSIRAGGDASFVIATSQLSSQPTMVRYTLAGTARMGIDYSVSGTTGEADIPAGASSVRVTLHAFNGLTGKRPRRAALKLVAGTAYQLTASKKAVVTITP
ncbi:MAG: D-alanyl-D-alanine carboxypeptidase family protein [Chthoniobacterales bacterium]